MDLVASGKINIKPLITHFYKLEETLEALKRAKTGEGGAIKVRFFSISCVLLAVCMYNQKIHVLWKICNQSGSVI